MGINHSQFAQLLIMVFMALTSVKLLLDIVSDIRNKSRCVHVCVK